MITHSIYRKDEECAGIEATARKNLHLESEDIIVFYRDGKPEEMLSLRGAQAQAQEMGITLPQDIVQAGEALGNVKNNETTRPVEVPSALLKNALPFAANARLTLFVKEGAEPREIAASEAELLSAVGVEADASQDGEPWQIGGYVGVDAVREYDGALYRCIQAHVTQGDWTPPAVPALWTREEAQGDTRWQAGAAYKVGDERTYDGRWYVCTQGHTALAGWEPPKVPALWRAM